MDAVRNLLRDRFSDCLDDPTAMVEAYVCHNDAVRAQIPASRLLEWNLGDGWDPICERLGLPVPGRAIPRHELDGRVPRDDWYATSDLTATIENHTPA